jgi:hypothetical protein
LLTLLAIVADVTLDVTMTNRYTRYGCRLPIRSAQKKQKQEIQWRND